MATNGCENKCNFGKTAEAYCDSSATRRLLAPRGALLGLLVLAFGLPLLLVRSPAAVSATSGVEP